MTIWCHGVRPEIKKHVKCHIFYKGYGRNCIVKYSLRKNIVTTLRPGDMHGCY